jgi:hypothetical protein
MYQLVDKEGCKLLMNSIYAGGQRYILAAAAVPVHPSLCRYFPSSDDFSQSASGKTVALQQFLDTVFLHPPTL